MGEQIRSYFVGGLRLPQLEEVGLAVGGSLVILRSEEIFRKCFRHVPPRLPRGRLRIALSDRADRLLTFEQSSAPNWGLGSDQLLPQGLRFNVAGLRRQISYTGEGHNIKTQGISSSPYGAWLAADFNHVCSELITDAEFAAQECQTKPPDKIFAASHTARGFQLISGACESKRVMLVRKSFRHRLSAATALFM